jgi:hypothetical protein
MKQQEIQSYLQDNLKIDISTDYDAWGHRHIIKVRLLLNDTEISSCEDYIRVN